MEPDSLSKVFKSRYIVSEIFTFFSKSESLEFSLMDKKTNNVFKNICTSADLHGRFIKAPQIKKYCQLFPSLKSMDLNRNFIDDISVFNEEQMEDLIILDLSFNNKILDYSPLINIPKLEQLYLNGNNLSQNSLDIFSQGKFENLKILELSNNPNIKDLSALKSLVNLEKLDLSLNYLGNNSLNFFEKGFFNNLTELDLTVNPEIIYYEPLKNIINLKKLIVSSNKNFKYTLFEDCKYNDVFMHLEELICNKIENNENLSLLGYIKNLRILNLSENEITSISEFENKRSDNENKKLRNTCNTNNTNFKKLEELDLSSNYKIDNYLPLASLPKLKKLKLEKNSIKNLDFFQENFKNLTDLNLSYNDIRNFDQLQNLTNLQILNIAGNHIEDISFISIAKYQNLIELNISENKNISDYSPLSSIEKLEKLNLSGNYINNSLLWFTGCKQLEFLDLSYNNLKSLDNVGLNYLSTNLKVINLSHNHLTRLYIAKEFCANVQELNLSHNNFTELESLTNFVELRKLNLACNEILFLIGLEKCNFFNLEVLNLCNNEIASDNYNYLKRFWKLKKLNLSYNNITNLTWCKKQFFPYLEELHLGLTEECFKSSLGILSSLKYKVRLII